MEVKVVEVGTRRYLGGPHTVDGDRISIWLMRVPSFTFCDNGRNPTEAHSIDRVIGHRTKVVSEGLRGGGR